jgi:predicted nucleic acid-binding protein
MGTERETVVFDADYIVSGDDDLLELEEFRGVSIVTPEEFLRQV